MDTFMLLAQAADQVQQVDSIPWLDWAKTALLAAAGAVGPAIVAYLERRKSAKAQLLAKAGQFLIEWVEKKNDKALKEEIHAASVEKKQDAQLDAAVQKVTG